MIIKNGIVADPASGLYEHMDILVKDGKIVKIAPDISYESDAATTEKEEIIDACVESVKAAGYEVFIEPKDIKIASTPAFPARIAFCKGPLGEEIELFEEK